MQPFEYRHGDLYCENVLASDITARFGTPTLVYSAASLTTASQRYYDAFSAHGIGVLFSVKACPAVGCLRRIAKAGLGMIATNGPDVERAWLSRSPMSSAVFAGVSKSEDDIRAALDGIYSPLFQAGVTLDGRAPYYRGPIGWFVADSIDEIERIGRVAKGLRINCRVALRVRTEELAPDAMASRAVDSKFGMPVSMILEAFERFREAPNMRLCGVHGHLGPNTANPTIHTTAAAALSNICQRLLRTGHMIELLDLGGGFAPLGLSIEAPTPEVYADAMAPEVAWAREAGVSVVVEPGAAIAAAAAMLLVRTLDVKPLEDRDVLITDGGLSAAASADAEGSARVVWPVLVDPGKEPPRQDTQRVDPAGMRWYDVAGPTGWDDDAIARGRLMAAVQPRDILAVFGMGAYPHRTIARDHAFSLPAEVLVDGLRSTQLRARRDFCDRIAPEVVALDATAE